VKAVSLTWKMIVRRLETPLLGNEAIPTQPPMMQAAFSERRTRARIPAFLPFRYYLSPFKSTSIARITVSVDSSLMGALFWSGSKFSIGWRRIRQLPACLGNHEHSSILPSRLQSKVCDLLSVKFARFLGCERGDTHRRQTHPAEQSNNETKKCRCHLKRSDLYKKKHFVDEAE
jgi:hypothetical protein